MAAHGSLTWLGLKQPVPNPVQAELGTVVLARSPPECTSIEVFLWLCMGSFPLCGWEHFQPGMSQLFVLEVESLGTPVISQGWAQAPSDLRSTPLPLEAGQRVTNAALKRGANPLLRATYGQPGNRVAKPAQDQDTKDAHISTQIPGGFHHNSNRLPEWDLLQSPKSNTRMRSKGSLLPAWALSAPSMLATIQKRDFWFLFSL